MRREGTHGDTRNTIQFLVGQPNKGTELDAEERIIQNYHKLEYNFKVFGKLFAPQQPSNIQVFVCTAALYSGEFRILVTISEIFAEVLRSFHLPRRKKRKKNRKPICWALGLSWLQSWTGAQQTGVLSYFIFV
jgi:hypothetical protein